MAYHPCYLPTMRSFFFQQDKHYKSGFVLDDDNHVVYKLYDQDDDHFWGRRFKDRVRLFACVPPYILTLGLQPTIITRTSDKKSLGSIEDTKPHSTIKLGCLVGKGRSSQGGEIYLIPSKSIHAISNIR